MSCMNFSKHIPDKLSKGALGHMDLTMLVL
jgi:hypothetical protein